VAANAREPTNHGSWTLAATEAKSASINGQSVWLKCPAACRSEVHWRKLRRITSADAMAEAEQKEWSMRRRKGSADRREKPETEGGGVAKAEGDRD
jgi:hypothetical protein